MKRWGWGDNVVKLLLKIYTELDFEDIKFYTKLDFVKIEFKKHEHFTKQFQNEDILLHNFKIKDKYPFSLDSYAIVGHLYFNT